MVTISANCREYELNYRLGNAMLALDNIQNTCLGEVLQYIRFLMIICYEWTDCIYLMIRLNEFEVFIWVYNDDLEFRKK